MAESPYTGLTASVKIGGHPTGDTVAYISGVTLSLSKDIIEILAFGMEYKEKVPAIKDWTLSADGTAAFDATGTQAQLLDAFQDGTLVTFTVYLNTTTYFEGSAYLESLEIDAAPDDKINISLEASGNNGVVFSIAGGTGMLTFVCTDHATAGATQVASVAPTLTGGNNYMYKINAALPMVGATLDSTWIDYTLAGPIMTVNGNIVTLAEVTSADVVVYRGQATAVIT